MDIHVYVLLFFYSSHGSKNNNLTNVYRIHYDTSKIIQLPIVQPFLSFLKKYKKDESPLFCLPLNSDK